jgi:hypothetical protein
MSVSIVALLTIEKNFKNSQAKITAIIKCTMKDHGYFLDIKWKDALMIKPTKYLRITLNTLLLKRYVKKKIVTLL